VQPGYSDRLLKRQGRTKDAEKPDEKKPEAHYCWLVFGPESKARALVRVNGEEVAVDRDGDGKFDGKGERFKSEKDCKDVVIADRDGRTSYVISHVHVLHVVPPEKFLEVRVHVRGDLEYHQIGLIQMAHDRKTAPHVHFNGPLGIAPKGWRIVNRASRLVENEVVDVGSLIPQSLKRLAGKELVIESTLPQSLKRTGAPTNLSAGVVTEGENGFVSLCSPDDTEEGRREKAPFPKGIHPFVDVEFPAKKPGDPPLKKRYPLDQHAGDGCYRGPVRVPEEAGVGKAKVTFSLEAWKGVKVAPTTVEIPIDEPREEKNDQKKGEDEREFLKKLLQVEREVVPFPDDKEKPIEPNVGFYPPAKALLVKAKEADALREARRKAYMKLLAIAEIEAALKKLAENTNDKADRAELDKIEQAVRALREKELGKVYPLEDLKIKEKQEKK
jgi:hypothetical protein